MQCTVSFPRICFNWTWPSWEEEDYRSRASASPIFAAKNRMGVGLKEGRKQVFFGRWKQSCASNLGGISWNEWTFFFSFFSKGSIHPSRTWFTRRKRLDGSMWPTMNRFMIELNSSVSSLWGEYKYNLIMRYGNKKYGIITIASFAPAWK